MTIADVIKHEFELYATQNGQKPDLRYLESSLVSKYVKNITGKDSIYSIRDAEVANSIYMSVQKDLDNINAHLHYSAAVHHYCKFLSLKVKVKK